MESLQIIEGINEAIKTLSSVRRELATGSTTIWRILDHAVTHLDAQIAVMLAAEPEKMAERTEDGITTNSPKVGTPEWNRLGWRPTELPSTLKAERAAEDRTRTGNTPTCEDCGKDYDHCDCDERDPADVLDYQPGD